MRVIAHFTCPLDAPENSLAGIGFAGAQRANLVEVDVRLTRDLVPVLCHDAIPWRTLRWPLPVRLSRLSALRRWGARRGEGPADPRRRRCGRAGDDDLAVNLKDGRAAQPVVQVLQATGLIDRGELWVRHRSAALALTDPAVGLRRALLRPARTPTAVRRYIHRARRLHLDAVCPRRRRHHRRAGRGGARARFAGLLLGAPSGWSRGRHRDGM